MALRSIPPHTRQRLKPSLGAARTQKLGAGMGSGSGYGRIYRSDGARARLADLLIPPRSSGAPLHQIADTPSDYQVLITFPTPVSQSDLHWELNGDVLEVEYTGPHFAYYHNFLVPNGRPPVVSCQALSFEVSFPKGAAGSENA